jgi:hypothetical protein
MSAVGMAAEGKEGAAEVAPGPEPAPAPSAGDGDRDAGELGGHGKFANLGAGLDDNAARRLDAANRLERAAHRKRERGLPRDGAFAQDSAALGAAPGPTPGPGPEDPAPAPAPAESPAESPSPAPAPGPGPAHKAKGKAASNTTTDDEGDDGYDGDSYEGAGGGGGGGGGGDAGGNGDLMDLLSSMMAGGDADKRTELHAPEPVLSAGNQELVKRLKASAPRGGQPALGYHRYPHTRGGKVVFVSEGNIWVAGVNGGPAARLSASYSYEALPKLSADGAQVAFLVRRCSLNRYNLC